MGIDMVNHPPHYNHGGIETIELIEMYLSPEEFIGYLKGTVLKYRERAPYKGKLNEDYDKAYRYWSWLLEKKTSPKELEGNAGGDVINFQGGVDCLAKAIEKCEMSEAVLVEEETVTCYSEGVPYEVLTNPRCPKCKTDLKTGDNYCRTCGVALKWGDANESNLES